MTLPQFIARLELIESLIRQHRHDPRLLNRNSEIKLAVAKAFGVTVEQIHARHRPNGIIPARHTAMWLCHRLRHEGDTQQSLAGAFNRVDHATILHAVNKIEGQIYGYHEQIDPVVARIKDAVDNLLTTPA